MKILHITTRFFPFCGGLEHMVLGLGTEQTKKHEVLVLTLKHDETLPDYEEKNGIKIHRMPEIPVLKRRYTIPKKGYEQKLKDIDPDVIITHARFFMPSYLAGRYSRKHGKKWIHVEHSADFIRSKNLVIHSGARVIDLIFGKWIFKNSDQVVVLSEKARQFVQNFSGRSMGVSIIRNGIEVPYKTPYNLPMNKKALFLGRMVEEKGIFYILEAAKKSPNWQFELAGEFISEKVRQQFEKEKTFNIHFLGALPHKEVAQKLKSIDILLLPSINEGLPLVVLEAAALGRPILCGDSGANSEIVSDDFLLKNISGSDIAKKLKSFSTEQLKK